MHKFFAFLNRMKYIKRWSLMRSVREENIAEHTFQVISVAHALAVIQNAYFGGNLDVQKTLLYAQYHEAGEVITGDLPTPIKYFNEEIRDAYKYLEKNACVKLLGMLPEEMQKIYSEYVFPDVNSEEYKIVKLADRTSAYLKCIEEVKAGNAEFRKAKASIEKELKEKNCEALRYFLNDFAPAYELTLDELD